jgi:hypothetical protein
MRPVGACARVVLLVVATAGLVRAATDGGDDKTLGWFNATDLSLVVTDGNSDTQTLGFKNTLRRVWKESSLRVKLDVVESDTADDRYLLVGPGLEWEPGATPSGGTTSVVEPPTEPDVRKYFAESRFSRKILERFMWNAGASWDRNEDAGILNRTILFAGVGHDWWDRDDLKLATDYSLSHTDREEETPDPLKEDRFLGARFGLDFKRQFGKAADRESAAPASRKTTTSYESDFTGNLNLEDTSDYNLDITNAVAVGMSSHLTLKVSLQWLYSNEPALEDVDVIARVEVIDPDLIPGNGDEFFRTVGEGGAEIELGESQVRKDELDTVFRTSLVIDF